jgi:hypothetical protein
MSTPDAIERLRIAPVLGTGYEVQGARFEAGARGERRKLPGEKGSGCLGWMSFVGVLRLRRVLAHSATLRMTAY